MKGDEWKPIPNFSWYLASNTGQIFDIAEEKITKQYDNHGYKLVRVMNDSGKVENVGVHRLVYQAFYGIYPKHLEINHIGDACRGCRKSAGGFTWRYL